MKRLVASVVAGSLAFAAGRARAEDPPRRTTLEQAVAEALANHPRIATARAEEAAAGARVDEARTGELPQVGVSAQLNRSTGNTVPGAFFPQVGFVPIAGPTRGKTFDAGAWQSGASLWATWDVVSLAKQAAAIDVALASTREAEASTSAQRLEVAYRAADAYLTLAEADEAVRVANVNVDRATVLRTVTKALADQNLRPGADAARADAELAAARTQVARAEQSREVRRAALAEAMGDPSRRIEVDAAPLVAAPDDAALPRGVSPTNPEIARSDAAIARAGEVERLVKMQYLPRVDLVASLWMRGSGLFDAPANGLVPDVPNWAAGATITWSFLDIPTIRARARAASATRDAAVAKKSETVLAVQGELASASAVLEGSRRVAKQTQPTLAAARVAEEQAAARFKTGLAPVVDVADAQRVLAQAELEEAVARLEVRRAELLLARAAGDLGPFLARAGGTDRRGP